jgi:heme-degrading monooxygenase HmoA
MLRTIVGTWQTRDAWQSWHGEDVFRETRGRLDGLQVRPSDTTWYDVIEERHGE